MLSFERYHGWLFRAAHLFSIFLLPGLFVFLLYRENGGNLPMYVFWTWYWLARVLPYWVGGLLAWRLWQRRWGRATRLVFLLGVDVLVLFGYQVAFFVSSMAEGPS